MSNLDDIRKKSFIYMIRNIMNVLFPLVTFKYASTRLAPSGIGVANYSSAVVSYFGLIAQLGISAYAVAEGAKIRNDREKLKQFSNELFTINIISTMAAYLSLFVLVFFTPIFADYKTIILIYSVTIIGTTIGVEWIYVIYEDFIYITIRSIVFQIISLIFLFLFVKNEDNVPAYAIASVISSSASYLFNYIHVRKYFKIGFVRFRDVKCHLRPVFSLWIANVASLIYVNADMIIVGILYGDEQVGIYSASARIVKAVCGPISTISTVSGPQIAQAIGEENKTKVNELTRNVSEFLMMLIFPCVIGLFTLASESILFISGAKFLSGVSAEKILLLDIFISPLNSFFTNQIMVPAKKEKQTMYAMIFAATANVVLDFLLIPLIGINGAAIATVVSELTVLIVCLPDVKREISLKYCFENWWKYLCCSLVIIPISVLGNYIYKTWWIKTIVVVTISSVSYFAIIYMLNKKRLIQMKHRGV